LLVYLWLGLGKSVGWDVRVGRKFFIRIWIVLRRLGGAWFWLERRRGY